MLQVFSLAPSFFPPPFSSRMTEEEREKAQEQLTALSQAYNELAQQCSDQTTAAEEVWTLECFDVLIRKQCHLLVRCMTNHSPVLCSE